IRSANRIAFALKWTRENRWHLRLQGCIFFVVPSDCQIKTCKDGAKVSVRQYGDTPAQWSRNSFSVLDGHERWRRELLVQVVVVMASDRGFLHVVYGFGPNRGIPNIPTDRGHKDS